MADELVIYAVFDRPLDFPDHVVVRPQIVWRTAGGSQLVFGDPMLASTLEEARTLIPPGLVRLARQDGDPLFLVESWL